MSNNKSLGNIPSSDKEISGSFGDINVGSISSVKNFNNILWADTPDDINAQFDKLPAQGGLVKLVPGEYDDADFSAPIEIPSGTDSVYGLDMSGSDITLSSFAPSGAYIQKLNPNNERSSRIFLHGPSAFNVQSVTAPPSAASLWDLEQSVVRLPNLKGNFEYALESHQANGSGHWNKFYVASIYTVNGILVKRDGVSNDRSEFYGQLGRLENIGVDVQGGQWNDFYCQVENEKVGFSTTGYKFDTQTMNNTIWKVEEGASTPFDIRGKGNEVKYNFPPAGREIFINSKAAVKPSNWENSYWNSTHFDATVDVNSMLDTAGAGSVSANAFGSHIIDAGSTDTNTQKVQTIGRPGSLLNGVMSYVDADPKNTSNVIYRNGIWADSSNYVVLEADSTATNTNWHAKVVTGGTEALSVDTGVTLDTNRHEFFVMVSENTQEFCIDYSNEVSGTIDMTTAGSNWRPRVSVTVSGTPASARTMNMHQFEYMGLP